jgi:hypothetical protein
MIRSGRGCRSRPSPGSWGSTARPCAGTWNAACASGLWPAGRRRAEDRAAESAEDAREPRLLLPALPRPQPHPRAGPARLRRPRRGPALPWTAGHRKEPSRHRPRRRRGEGREGRLPLHSGRAHRGARPRRARPSQLTFCVTHLVLDWARAKLTRRPDSRCLKFRPIDLTRLTLSNINRLRPREY